MKIILSPAKKMKEDMDSFSPRSLPCCLQQTREILDCLRRMSSQELQALWGCSDQITRQNMDRLSGMELSTRLTPAILAYEGIAFQYMAPAVFSDRELAYTQEHLRILSGFYGVLRPLDGVRSYRLEMQAPLSVSGHKDLYDFWGKTLYDEVRDESGIFLNLASREYSKCIQKYLQPEDTFLTCTFAEMVNGKLRQKGTFAKMARGEMVRYLAECGAETPEAMKNFDRLNYHFREDLSTDSEYIFERIAESH